MLCPPPIRPNLCVARASARASISPPPSQHRRFDRRPPDQRPGPRRFTSGVVAYSNDVKRRVLVPDTVLARHGASVRRPPAMAWRGPRLRRGCRRRTGIAARWRTPEARGPAHRRRAAAGVVVARFQFDGDRASVRIEPAAPAMLLRYCRNECGFCPSSCIRLQPDGA